MKHIIKKLFSNAIIQDIIARIISLTVRFLSMTYRFEITGLENIKKYTDKNKPVLISLWHGRSIVLPYFWSKYFKNKSGAAVFSDHKDGRLMQAICKRFGVLPIIGSSNKKGAFAARGIISALKNGTTVAMTPDGPTGPRMRLTTDSLLFFAGRLNIPIIPFTPSSKNAKILNSWDRYVIHRPFAKVHIKIGKPFIVKKSEIEDEKTKLKLEKILISDLQKEDKKNGLAEILAQPRNLKRKSRE